MITEHSCERDSEIGKLDHADKAWSHGAMRDDDPEVLISTARSGRNREPTSHPPNSQPGLTAAPARPGPKIERRSYQHHLRRPGAWPLGPATRPLLVRSLLVRGATTCPISKSPCPPRPAGENVKESSDFVGTT